MSRALRETSLWSGLEVQTRVIGALLLRDMRTRFGRRLSGWVIMVLWPLSHLAFITIGYLLAHRVAPIGPSPTVFVSTGVLPYILCLYPARMIQLCVVGNQPLLLFPPVQALDIIFARSILEVVNSFYVVALFCLALFCLDIDFIPADVPEAICAIFANIYLGISIGMISAVIFKLFRPWIAIQVGMLILGYLSSGAIVPLTNAPAAVRNFVFFNPIFHCVEWLRFAYYGQAAQSMLSKEYLLGYSTVLFFGTLVLERATRGLLMKAS